MDQHQINQSETFTVTIIGFDHALASSITGATQRISAGFMIKAWTRFLKRQLMMSLLGTTITFT